MNCPECEMALAVCIGVPVIKDSPYHIYVECPGCGWSKEPSDESIIKAALQAHESDESNGPPDDSDAWSGGFAENH